jgi:hypothetical protein
VGSLAGQPVGIRQRGGRGRECQYRGDPGHCLPAGYLDLPEEVQGARAGGEEGAAELPEQTRQGHPQHLNRHFNSSVFLIEELICPI